MRKGMIIITALALLDAMFVSCSNENDDKLSTIGNDIRKTTGEESA